jgi:succinoglycan biosynthesis transport protein ExoP
LKANSVMRNEIVQQSQTTANPIAFAPQADALSRLEPIAVPLGRIASTLRRHIWVLTVVFAIGVGGTYVVVRLLPKQYTAAATILIQSQHTQVSDLQAISPDSGDVNSLIRTQIDLLRSPALAMGVVRALDLTKNPEFAPHGGNVLEKIKALMEEIGLRRAVPETPLTLDDETQIAGAILNSKLGFANEARSSVLSVSVVTRDPALSARIANEVANQFLDFKRQEKFAAMQRAHDWFQDQMGKLADEVSAADRAVEQYRQQHGLDELPPDGGNSPRADTINRQLLDAINGQLAEVSREVALKQGQLAQAQAVMRGEASADALPQVLASPIITQVLSEISTVVGHEAQLAATQGPGNPELAAMRAQHAKLQVRAELAMAKVVSSLNADIKAARTQDQLLRQQIERLRAAVSTENSALQGLQVPQTKARATRSIYESFLNRATQLANVAGIQEQDASLVSGARPPLAPSAPQAARLIAVAALLSLVFGVAIACLIERMRTGFSLPEQLEGILGLPLVAVIPTVPRATLRGRCKNRAGIAFFASLDKLRGQMRALGERQPKVLMITSALPKEGKSAFALGLARSASAAGLQVLLVECDFRCPSLGVQFGLQTAPGLRNLLTSGVLGETSKVIHEPEPGLHIILGGHGKGDPQELLASDKMHALVASVRARYDLVVLDTPPVLPVADALVVAKQADATLMVVRWEKTARTPTLDAVRLLHDCRARIIGAVMTRVDRRTAARLGGSIAYAFGHYDGYHFPLVERA